MKLTNTTNNRFNYVSQVTIDVLNFLAAKGFVSHTEENHEGYFYCRVADVANAIQKSSATAQRHIEKLRSLKVLDIRVVGGSKSIYKINPFKVTEI